jgi:hypothetical protein
MRRFEGHQQGQTKPDVAVFTESAAVKVRYIFATSEHAIAPSSRHSKNTYVGLMPVDSAEFMCLQELEEFPAGEVSG